MDDIGMEEVKGMNKDTKVCTTCGLEKPLSEFRNRRLRKDGTMEKRSKCHACHISYMRKRYSCAKNLCSKMNQPSRIIITCPVCSKPFGVTQGDYNTSLKRRGYPPKYCCSRCQYIGMRKAWQQTKSPYAKKIKELRKIHGV